MNVTVINKKESVIYKGTIYGYGESFEVDEKIGNSLIERKIVKEIDEAGLQTGVLDENQLSEMSYPDLKKLASQMGLDASGKKDVLIARILATEGDDEVEGENIDNDENAAQGENLGDTEGDDEVEGDIPVTSMPE